jgi:hypothetical protein
LHVAFDGLLTSIGSGIDRLSFAICSDCSRYDADGLLAKDNYRRLLKEGANVVVLEPDVAKAFRSSAAVNEALQSLLRVLRQPASNFTLQRTGNKRPPLSVALDGSDYGSGLRCRRSQSIR